MEFHELKEDPGALDSACEKYVEKKRRKKREKRGARCGFGASKTCIMDRIRLQPFSAA